MWSKRTGGLKSDQNNPFTHPTLPYPTPTCLTLPCLTSPCLTSPYLTSPHPTLLHPTSPHPASPHPTSPHPTSRHPTQPHPASPHPTLLHPTLPHQACDQENTGSWYVFMVSFGLKTRYWNVLLKEKRNPHGPFQSQDILLSFCSMTFIRLAIDLTSLPRWFNKIIRTDWSTIM